MLYPTHHGSTYSAMVIIVGNGYGGLNLNPVCISYSANTLGKSMHPNIFLLVMSK